MGAVVKSTTRTFEGNVCVRDPLHGRTKYASTKYCVECTKLKNNGEFGARAERHPKEKLPPGGKRLFTGAVVVHLRGIAAPKVGTLADQLGVNEEMRAEAEKAAQKLEPVKARKCTLLNCAYCAKHPPV